MKCLSCDCILTDREATRKYKNIDEFVDLCNDCFAETDIHYNEYEDLEVSDERINKDGELSEL